VSPPENESADTPSTEPPSAETRTTDKATATDRETTLDDAPSPGRSTVDRRTVLATSGVVLAGPVLGSADHVGGDTSTAHPAGAADGPATVTVTSRNLSLGVRLARLFDVQSTDELHRTAGNLLENVREHPYGARLDTIAAEIAAADPAVVAVQEATRVRERPADADEEWTTVVDIRDGLESSLADAELAYERAASVVTTDIELPAETDDGSREVRFTDRNALLVRSDVEWRDPQTGTYDEQFGLPTSDLGFERGFCTAEVTVDDQPLTVASTHLESVSASVRRGQARELVERLPEDGRVVLTGDFNSGPGGDTDAYDLLRESLTDSWATVRPDDDGFTCCQGQQLTNDESLLHERVDAVFVRGGLRPTAVERVGHRPEDRVTATRDGETVTVWPSDHAGVVATFELLSPGATPTTSPTPNTETTRAGDPRATVRDTESPEQPASSASNSSQGGDRPATETSDGSSSGLGPGFGVVSGAGGAALATLALLRARWREWNRTD